jgi:hypothetical protein
VVEVRERHIHAGREPTPDAVTGRPKWWGSLCGYAMTRREYGASKGTEGPLCWVCGEEAKRKGEGEKNDMGR